MRAGERRAIDGAALLAILVVGLALGRLAFAIAVGLIAVAASWDALGRKRELDSEVMAANAGVTALVVTAYVNGDGAAQVLPVTIASVFVAIFTSAIVRTRVQGTTLATANALLGVVVVGLLASYLVAIVRLDGGRRVLVGVFLVLVGSVLASVASNLGRKSAAAWWQSFVAGTVGAGAAAVICALVLHPPFTVARAAGLAVAAAILIPAGQASLALLVPEERPVTILPHIGGLLFLAPFVFYAYRALLH